MKNYNLRIIIQLMLIFINMIALSYIMPDDRLFFSKIILFTVLIIQILLFLNSLRSLYRTMSSMINALRNRDFTLAFQKSGYGKSIDNFYSELSGLMHDIKEERTEDKARLQYLNMAFEKIDAGIISVRDNKEILLINERARKLLGIASLNSWQEMQVQQPGFYSKVNELMHGGTGMMTVRSAHDDSQLTISVNPLRFLNHDYAYITFKDIRDELDRTEFQAWQKLIRILTHEIMNSVTPVSSMAENMTMLIERLKSDDSIMKESMKDLTLSAQTIRRRSDGLLEFVDNYRNLTRISTPKIIETDIGQVIDSVLMLLKGYGSNVTFQKNIEIDRICLDRSLIEQVLINLIRNSIEAIPQHRQAQIVTRTFNREKWKCISVSDNGEGISGNEKNEVFTPFFTTKKEGSGIGLSLSKQIMISHNGHIALNSDIAKGTTVTLDFPL